MAWRAGLIVTIVAMMAVHAAQAEPYKRSLYRHWIDADGNCRDTREEVLIAESRVAVTMDRRGCKVRRGEWLDPYTGRTFVTPGRLDIDHFVPLKEAHISGASRWSAERRQAYANDLSHPDTLIAVALGANRSKGDKDPARWMPPNRAYHCEYIATWVAVKARWNLSMDERERAKIQAMRASCPADLRLLFLPMPQ